MLEKKARKSKIFFGNGSKSRIDPLKNNTKVETEEERDLRYPPWVKPIRIDNKFIKLVEDYKFESAPLPRLPKPNIVVDSLLALVCARVGVNVTEAHQAKIEEQLYLN